jgi:hypothetical protein
MKPRIEEGIVSCPKCGLSYDREEENVRVNGNVLWNPDTFHASSLNIMEVERGLEALPTTAHFGGCFRQGLLTNQLLNSIAALSVLIPGETIANLVKCEFESQGTCLNVYMHHRNV